MFNCKKGEDKKKYWKFKAFTLVELLVGTIISSVVLLWIFSMTSEVLDEAVFTNKSVSSFSTLYDIEKELNIYKNIYSTGNVLIDNESWTWSDVFIFLNTDNSEWFLIWIVNNYTRQLVPNSDYSLYKDNSLWFRKLIWTWIINNIIATPSIIYSSDYMFQKDKIFQDFKVRDLQMIDYNGRKIREFKFIVNMFYNENLLWEYWDNILKNRLVDFTLNF